MTELTLTDTQTAVLRALALYTGPARADRVAGPAGLTARQVTAAATALVRRGLVTRSLPAMFGRVYLYAITDPGRAALTQIGT